MARSNVDVCNSALQKVGSPPIASLSETSIKARACSQAFDLVRRDLLSKYDWNFARKRVVLAPDASQPPFGFKFVFTPPSDYLQAIIPDKRFCPVDWQFEGGKILSNMGDTLRLCYTADMNNASVWPAPFYNAMVCALAADICIQLTEDAGKKQQILTEFVNAVAEAKRANAIVKPQYQRAINNWLHWRLT